MFGILTDACNECVDPQKIYADAPFLPAMAFTVDASPVNVTWDDLVPSLPNFVPVGNTIGQSYTQLQDQLDTLSNQIFGLISDVDFLKAFAGNMEQFVEQQMLVNDAVVKDISDLRSRLQANADADNIRSVGDTIVDVLQSNPVTAPIGSTLATLVPVVAASVSAKSDHSLDVQDIINSSFSRALAISNLLTPVRRLLSVGGGVNKNDDFMAWSGFATSVALFKGIVLGNLAREIDETACLFSYGEWEHWSVPLSVDFSGALADSADRLGLTDLITLGVPAIPTHSIVIAKVMHRQGNIIARNTYLLSVGEDITLSDWKSVVSTLFNINHQNFFYWRKVVDEWDTVSSQWVRQSGDTINLPKLRSGQAKIVNRGSVNMDHECIDAYLEQGLVSQSRYDFLRHNCHTMAREFTAFMTRGVLSFETDNDEARRFLQTCMDRLDSPGFSPPKPVI
jgi:hypothetical protein